jgi:hypothetical protein
MSGPPDLVRATARAFWRQGRQAGCGHPRALYAKRRGINLNTVVSDALRQYLERDEHAA